MNLTIEYQFTFEEYKEASEALAAAYRKGKGKRFQLNYPFKIGRGIFGWVLFIALAIMLFLLLNQRGGAARPAARPMDVILPIIPWVLILGFVWFFLYRQLRGWQQRAWDSNPIWHRPRRVHIDDDGITFTDPVSEHRSSWAAYVKFDETPNLFLLFLTSMTAEMIPKRAFPDAKSLDDFRELLSRTISPPQAAFPVIPRGESAKQAQVEARPE